MESTDQQTDAPTVSTDGETEPAGETLALSERLAAPADKSQRAFRLALVAALLVHASLLIEIGRSMPRTIGDRSGASDAIAVDLVTEADLRSRETVSLPAAGAPVPPPAAAPQPDEPQPTEPKPEAQEPPPQAEAPAPKVPAPEEKPQQQAALPDFESMLKDLATTPLPEEAKETPQDAKETQEPKETNETKETKETKKTNETKEAVKPAEKAPPSPPRKKAQEQEQARLEPTPRDLMTAPPGRSAAASRPPGITRSGENDEFGRAVVRALRQTMPPPRGILGRVTVRLILTENGDLAEVRVLDASGTSLDQSVVFATKQTYFPLPPYKATLADRTFLITYVYR